MRTIKKLLFTLLPLICAASNPMVHALPKINLQKKETKSHIKKIAFVGGTTISISIACFILYIINRKNTNSSQPIQPEKEPKDDTIIDTPEDDDKDLSEQESTMAFEIAATQENNTISTQSIQQAAIKDNAKIELLSIQEAYQKAQKIDIPDDTNGTIIAINWIYSGNNKSADFFKNLQEEKLSEKETRLPEYLHWYKWHNKFNILAMDSNYSMLTLTDFYIGNFLVKRINKQGNLKGIIILIDDSYHYQSAADYLHNNLFMLAKIMNEKFTINDVLFMSNGVNSTQSRMSNMLHYYCVEMNGYKDEHSFLDKKDRLLLRKIKDKIENDLMNRLPEEKKEDLKSRITEYAKNKHPEKNELDNLIDDEFRKYLVNIIGNESKKQKYRELFINQLQATEEFYQQRTKDKRKKVISSALFPLIEYYSKMSGTFESFIEDLRKNEKKITIFEEIKLEQEKNPLVQLEKTKNEIHNKKQERQNLITQVKKDPESYKTFFMLYEESGISSPIVNRFRDYYNNI